MTRILNAALFTAMIFVNYLAEALPLNNKTTGELSNSYPNLFVPAGITFSIWGVIYLLLLIFCIVQFRKSYIAIIKSTGLWFWLSCVFNISWIFSWHYRLLPLSLLVMICLLACMIIINYRLKELPSGLVKATFGIYLGWLCIAAIANVTVLLVHYDWRGWGISEERWTMVMIIAGMLITILAMMKFKNIFIPLSVIWAFTGIILKRHYDYRSIMYTAEAGIVILILAIVYALIKRSGATGRISTGSQE